MNPTAIVLRWYRQSTSSTPSRQPYTAEEVLQLLRVQPASHADTSRRASVHEVASRPSAWLDRLTKRQRREIGELADRLPSLVSHHALGGDTDTLVRRFGGWSGWRYERALEVAGACIADRLNDG